MPTPSTSSPSGRWCYSRSTDDARRGWAIEETDASRSRSSPPITFPSPFFLAFATGNGGLSGFGPSEPPLTTPIATIPNERMTPLFYAAAEATEEAILNALLAAGTATGRDGITAYGLTPNLLLGALDEARSLFARQDKRRST